MKALVEPLHHRRLFILAALAVALIAPANAHAYWFSTGLGSGNGSAATLDAPTNVVGTPGAGTVALSWSAVTPPGSGSVTYYVSRGGGNAGGDCPTSSAPTSVLTCTDTGLAAGTYSYTVTVVWHSWATASSPPVSVTLSYGAMDHFLLAAASTTPSPGAADNLTVTAKDSAGITVTSYTGSHSLTFAGASAIGTYNPTVSNDAGTATNFGTATSISFTNGVATVSGASNGVMRLYRAETASITVNEGGSYTSNALSVTVSPLGISTLSLAAASTTPNAGAADNLTITAKDTYGNTATAYTGSHSLTFSGASTIGTYNPTVTNSSGTAVAFGSATSITFTNGVATVSGSSNGVMTLYKAQTASIVVSDGTYSNGSGLSVTVSPAAMSSFSIPNPGTQTAGTQFSLTLTALDTYGNTATSYSGSKTVSFSGPSNSPNSTAPSYPSSVTFASGVGTAAITLYNAASSNITATESGHSGSTGAFTVNPLGASSFSVSTPTGTLTAGTAITISSIIAQDLYGNTATSYTGSKSLTFSGPGTSPNGTAPVYPSSVTFSSGIASSVSVTLYKAETTTLTAQNGSISGTTGSFTVNGTGVMTRFLIVPATTTPTAGVADNLTITMGDPYGNPVASYTGSHNLTFAGASTIGTYNPTVTNSSGTATNFGTATAITFTNGVATVSGSSNGVMKLYKVEAAAVTVRQSTGTAYTSNSVTFNVQPAAIGTFTVANPATQTAGTSFNLSITATDTYGNSNTGTRCLTFSGPLNSPNGTAPSYPAQGSCAAGQSQVTFTAAPTLVPVTLYRAASTTITVTDVQSGTSRTTAAFTVNPAAIDHFSMTAATTTPTAGATDALSITAQDPYDNTATSYTGAHNLTFSGAGSIRTYNPTVTNNTGTATNFGTATAITFTNGVSSAGGVMTLYKAQTAHIVVSDGTYDNGSGVTVTVGPAAFNNIALSAEKAVVRPGATDQLTIRAIDTYGNSAPGYADGAHNLTFSGGTGTRTVTDSGGTQVNFGTATSITFTNGVSTAGGVMRISTAQTANIVVTDGTHTSAPLRIVVSSVSALAVSAGGFHTCALRSDGAVECWGSDDSGQLGNGGAIPGTNSSNPVMVSGLTNATQVSAGKYHTCAVRSDGTVWCWGLNDYGQLGNGTTTSSSVPVQVRGVGGVGNLTGASSVTASGKFTCAYITASQSVVCWGRNASGQLGNGSIDGADNAHTTPTAVVGVGGAGTLGNVTAITSGANHACALLSSGGVDCWGLDDHGQLGNGGAIPGTNSGSPVQVAGVGGTGILAGATQISGGRMHVCALLSDHSVACWGRNENGELGNGTTTTSSFPVHTLNITTATQVSAGEYHSCALLADGTAQCWGAAAYGQIGDGTTADTSTPVTVIGPGGFGTLAGLANISAGGGDITETNDYEHTCALTTDGTVICWGQNNYGQLGDGTTTMSIFPTGVALL